MRSNKCFGGPAAEDGRIGLSAIVRAAGLPDSAVDCGPHCGNRMK
jgi:hypothetical protein